MSITAETQNIIEECVRRSHEGSIAFGEVVEKLMSVGVESYHADYRRNENTHYLPTDETCVVTFAPKHVSIADAFDPAGVREAVRGAQSGVVKYPEFMRLTMAAGCVGYIVWIAGRHVQYFGRRGEVHVEHFPAR